MRPSLRLAAALSIGLLAPMGAAAQQVGDYLGTEIHIIAAALRDMGHEVHEIELDDDDEIEVETWFRGREYEFEIDRRSGRIKEVEIDD